ncbi:MAG: VWA domain-containing protein [Terracidiphilus sp.]
MRRLILFGLLAALALPAAAARRVSVTQLDAILASDEAVHRTDLEVAQQIGDLAMTERLTGRALGRFAAVHRLGPHTALALQLLADQSAFLDPPQNELPATAVPDAAEQQRILEAARAYSIVTWGRLPNFFVTRVTRRFDDNLHALAKGDWPIDLKLQPAGSSSREVAFRDGREVDDSGQGAEAKKASPEIGLHSWGEFGSALTVVMADMAKQSVPFSHWELTPAGLAAVFHYAVPRDASHYAVVSGFDSETIMGRTQYGYSNRDPTTQQFARVPRERNHQTYTELPAYHGTISIDPTTGAVLRLTIVAELKSGDPLLTAETMVEYGPVQIGDRRFICPIHSLALSVERAGGPEAGDIMAWGGVMARPGKTTTLLINETSFVDYHRFGSTARILTDAATNNPANSQPASEVSPFAVLAPPNGQSSPVASAPALENLAPQPGEATASNSPTPASPAAAAAPGAPSPPAEPTIPEVSMSAATGVPDAPADAPPNSPDEYALRVTSRLVDVGLVAYDKKGHPVTDLKPSDLEIYDDGKKQEIRSFALAGSPAPTPPAPSVPALSPEPDAQEPSFANRAPTTIEATTPVPAPDIGSTILVIDESHIAWNDMSYARGQILKFLDSLGPGENVGIYSMTGLGFHVLAEVTADRAALIARMQAFLPTAQSVGAAQEEETRNRQHFDEVHNVADLNSVNGNHIDVPDGEQPVDPQLLTMGDDPARASFIILAQVARHLSAIPGHKKVVWVASDNVLADWQDQSVGIDKSPSDVAAYALHAQEAMNEAHAAVYPFDVSQVETGGVSADLQHSNVQLDPASADNAATAASAGAGGTAITPPVNRDTSPGRITAAMNQDLHPVQGPVRQVAAATGGRVIRRSGDLAAQLGGIVADGHATYQLSFSPQGPADGRYHTISIKLTGRRGLSLSYRTGYIFEKEPTTLRERFQQAVWRPADVSEIALSVRIARETAGANVNIKIAASDLGLRQQGGRWIDKLDIFFIRRDDAGLHARLLGQTLSLRLESATYEKLMPTGVPFERFVETKPAMASLRVLVVDENSGRMGSVTIPASAIGAVQ